MAAPPAFSTYVALSQERQARSVELRRTAFVITAVAAAAVVAMIYLNFRTQVVIRGEQVQSMVNQRTELTNRNNELAYRIAWESAPQRVEDRARKLKMAPITKWESIAVPGLAAKLNTAGPTALNTTGNGGAFPAEQQTKLDAQTLLAQLKDWLGLGLRTPAGVPAVP
jgi:cell division protein FtsL